MSQIPSIGLVNRLLPDRYVYDKLIQNVINLVTSYNNAVARKNPIVLPRRQSFSVFEQLSSDSPIDAKDNVLATIWPFDTSGNSMLSMIAAV